MLVLSRKPTEAIRIGPDVRIVLLRVGPNSARIGIEAPEDVNIVREEIYDPTFTEAEVVNINRVLDLSRH